MVVSGRILVQNNNFYFLYRKTLYYISDIDVRNSNLMSRIIDTIPGLYGTAELNDKFTEIIPGTLNLQ